ncbi:MFS general substrate transporter, partial [Ascoidea rubescens DSM 1968]
LLPSPSGSLNKPPTHDTLTRIDYPAFFLLVVLYILQGIPSGLAFGSIPFLLKSSNLSYSQVGIFSLASYPYSLKLLWSPLVDSFYWTSIGRRKSWIIPIQFVTGFLLILLGLNINYYFDDLNLNLFKITFFFLILITLCATQDIAVDGWALTILSPTCLSFASTAQTIGLNIGYFMSFTIFLALNSKDLMNRYFRKIPQDYGLVELDGYLIFWGVVYILVTVVVFYVPETPEHLLFLSKKDDHMNNNNSNSNNDNDNDNNSWNAFKKVYVAMYKVIKLKNVQEFMIILLISKIGFQVNESATSLKLLEKGFSKEDLALTTLIDFPFEIIFGYYVAKWTRNDRPLNQWMIGYLGRLVSGIFSQLIVLKFPKNGKITFSYFLIVILNHLFGSFMSTIQFVCLCGFHTKIADPVIGGTYMTTLNTLSNLGGTWPKFFIYKMIDQLTMSICLPKTVEFKYLKNYLKLDVCEQEVDGSCVIKSDGYYSMNMLCVSLGFLLYIFYIKRKISKLQSLPISQWRVRK